MNWALLIIYIGGALGLLISANQHGKPHPAYNFWIKLLALIIDLVLIWWATGWVFI